MSVKKEASGHRSVQLEFEVPGTPEQVWQAIATGPGISSWFVPTRVEEREGGAVAFQLGGGMESSGAVTAWEPPRRFAYEERDWSPGAPPLATEFLVEARSGDACVVRLVHSLFANSDEWDDQMEGFEAGWPPYFDILRIYLTHFRGQRCSPLRLMGTASGSEAEAWDELAAALGLAGAVPGERRETAASGAPALAGIVERRRPDRRLHLGRPCSCGDQPLPVRRPGACRRHARRASVAGVDGQALQAACRRMNHPKELGPG
jgi:uncharacterized protein YndB with AHSA1/START domain